MVEDDIKLVLGEYNSSFITYELTTGIYTFKDLSETLLKFHQRKFQCYHNAMDTEFDDITRGTKLFVRPSIRAIKFDDKSFFNTILGFNHGWD